MEKLTDYMLAEELGWKFVERQGNDCYPGTISIWVSPKGERHIGVPYFLSSLEEITAVIEEQGEDCVQWCITWILKHYSAPGLWDPQICSFALLHYLTSHHA